ncbi:cell wall hydrolase [Altererythrobacter sp. Root672]|uniref:cell wall hydrolase n=1 Tax=Altererythrobacter sp. Root672 TaxID=1736584 RepID=UPI000A84B994|nr:cell wall hydrolase [Altererythrobacter sp. Root672]
MPTNYRLPSTAYPKRARGHFGRRLAVLALAIAVPAMAAPEWQQSSDIAQQVVKPMGFETPGESFPGSAFYYLADQPNLPATASGRPVDGAKLALRPSTGRLDTSPVANPLHFAGTATDRLRAQQCLTLAIYYEAANEPDAGQRAVAQVVLNRVAHPNYPNTVCGVVFQGSERTTGCQFSFTCDGSLARKPARQWWDRAAKVARAALAGAVYAPAGLATHYHTVQIHPYWADSLATVGTIGAHRFYRWRGAAGTAAAFSDFYRGGEPLAAPHPRSVVNTPDPADPLALARAYEAALKQTARAAPAAQRAPEAETRSAEALPALAGSGQVREEYARSGQWLREP